MVPYLHPGILLGSSWAKPRRMASGMQDKTILVKGKDVVAIDYFK